MILVFICAGIFMLSMGTLALLAFAWAAREGQMQALTTAAESIFDREEHVGVLTDCFPDCQEKADRFQKRAAVVK
jgi:cbb3-type cytochrome oxidase maturation protein